MKTWTRWASLVGSAVALVVLLFVLSAGDTRADTVVISAIVLL